MPTFKFKAAATVSCWTEVKADTLEEAKAKAESRGLSGLSRYPFSGDVGESWHFENDGKPQEIELDDD